MSAHQRVSVLEADVGFQAFQEHGAFRREWTVTVDGVAMAVVTADVANGYVIRHKRRDDGTLEIDHERGEVVHEVVSGAIRVFVDGMELWPQ